MAGRFSFDDDDDSSFHPHPPSSEPFQQPQYQSARGRSDYQVASGASYIPPPIRSATSSPVRSAEPYSDSPYRDSPFHDPQQARMSDPFRDPRAARDSSPHIHNMLPIPPPPPMHRDAHSTPYTIPYPQQRSAPSYDQTTYDPGHYQAASHAPPSAHGYPDHPPQPQITHDPAPYQPPTNCSRAAVPAAAAAAGAGAGALAAGNHLAPGVNSRPAPDRLSSYGYGQWGNDSHGDLGSIDPRDIADEEDDASMQPRSKKKKSAILGGGAGGAGAGAAGAGATGGAGGFIKGLASRDSSGHYGQVPGGSGGENEKSSWLKEQTSRSKRLKWMVAGLIALVIILAIAGGAVGAALTVKKNKDASDQAAIDKGSDLKADSSAIKKLMKNPDLHKVFPGVDYTPFGAQYPACLSNMPSQNNVTQDIAVLSQLTPQVRLYGTDCKQVEMVLQAIENLNLQKDMRLWLGVYLDGNKTTNDRQISQMWNVLNDPKTDKSVIAGLIIGNEVMFSKYMSATQLTGLLDNVRNNLTENNAKGLSVSTSDLGSAWDDTLARSSDIVMSNVHPFFGGVPVDQAAGWTWSFWQNNDVAVSKKMGNPNQKQLISELGWPSEGGNDCGSKTGSPDPVPCSNPTEGAVAGVDEMNKFLEDWTCPALSNGTQYFL